MRPIACQVIGTIHCYGTGRLSDCFYLDRFLKNSYRSSKFSNIFEKLLSGGFIGGPGSLDGFWTPLGRDIGRIVQKLSMDGF